MGWASGLARGILPGHDRAAHAEPLPLAEYHRHRDAIYVKNRSRLAPLAHAKKELRGAERG